MAYSKLSLSSRFFLVIFSIMSNKLTPRFFYKSAEQSYRALYIFLLMTSWFNQEPEYALFMDQSRATSSRVIPSSKTALFSSSILQKSYSFQGEQFIFQQKTYLFSQPMRQGSMILMVPSSKMRIFQGAKKIVWNCLSYRSKPSLQTSCTNHRALRQLQSMLQRSSYLKYSIQVFYTFERFLGLRAQIKFERFMAEYQNRRWILKVCIQKFYYLSSQMSINLVIYMFGLIFDLQLLKYCSFLRCQSREEVLQVFRIYFYDGFCFLERTFSPFKVLYTLYDYRRCFVLCVVPI